VSEVILITPNSRELKKGGSLIFNNRIMKNLIALAHVMAMATTSNMTVVIEPKQDETIPYKAPIRMPEFEEFKCIDVFSTGKQRRTARRKAERDAKKKKV
jgi:hypothetical protein